MVVKPVASKWPGAKKKIGPREIGPSAATLRSAERELGVIESKSTQQGGDLANVGGPDPRASWPEERELHLDDVAIEGWVAGLPVVDGVADSGWEACEGGRVRVVIRIGDYPDQREWVRAMSYGGAYAKERLGQAA